MERRSAREIPGRSASLRGKPVGGVFGAFGSVGFQPPRRARARRLRSYGVHEEWIEPWASKYGAQVVGTELEAVSGTLTGRLNGANCRGGEKARRIAALVDLKSYDKIYAYGNSSGDREMLLLADEKVYNWDHVPEF